MAMPTSNNFNEVLFDQPHHFYLNRDLQTCKHEIQTCKHDLQTCKHDLQTCAKHDTHTHVQIRHTDACKTRCTDVQNMMYRRAKHDVQTCKTRSTNACKTWHTVVQRTTASARSHSYLFQYTNHMISFEVMHYTCIFPVTYITLLLDCSNSSNNTECKTQQSYVTETYHRMLHAHKTLFTCTKVIKHIKLVRCQQVRMLNLVHSKISIFEAAAARRLR